MKSESNLQTRKVKQKKIPRKFLKFLLKEKFIKFMICYYRISVFIEKDNEI